MEAINLQFRAKLPNNKWFYQNQQYLSSFLRRVLLFWQCGHEKYLDTEQIEDKLQIKINNKWIQCKYK